MKYKIRITPLVIHDIKSIVDYIAEDNETTAKEMGEKLYIVIEDLKTFPNSGSNLSNKISVKVDYKYVICERYMIVYKVQDDYVSVYRVFDMRRDYKGLL